MKEFAGEGILYFDLKRLHSGSLSRLAKWGSSEDVKIESSDYRWCFLFLVLNINIMRI